MNLASPEWLQRGTVIDLDHAEYEIASITTLRSDGPEIVALRAIRTGHFTALTVTALLRKYDGGSVRIVEVVKK